MRKRKYIDLYLPTYDYDKYPNRDLIFNVLNTLDYDKFQKPFKDSLNNRENAGNETKNEYCSDTWNQEYISQVSKCFIVKR